MLDGRRILVTGASRDSAIGFAICDTLARAGARLCLVGRRPEVLAATLAELPGDGHAVAPFDLTDLDAIPAWLKGVAAAGPLDGLVHSASVQGYTPLRTVKRQAFERYFTLNVGAALMLARGLSQRDVAAQSAALVFIGSAAGSRGLRARSLYAASKAALESVTRSLALELADRSIRVNCLAPAVVRGDRADQQMAMLNERQREALLEAHPLGFGEPEDVGQACAFLLSPAAARITGVVLPVDGGFAAG